ncbi:MAG: tRNA uridine-5-carboxymethylaminomethyl(34) synthesis GTPase MnmE [Clostridia bacterium]|nr:tRNA uridine-5-carboxymethylaminomethyl(34) synthesis GTPase MnmE [Clostridia bacterium]
MFHSTIAAIATPAGTGGIGIVRISGAEAKSVADRVFAAKSGKKIKDQSGYTALFGNVVFGGEVIDEAVALVFVAPKSYTGEDVVEISCHCGTAVVRKVLRAVLESGAQMAEPGEFTKRAYLNGKLDLASAETVINVINANSPRALRQANAANKGLLFERIQDVRQRLLNLAAEIGAVADYPDEELDNADISTLPQRVELLGAELNRMIKDYDTGAMIRDGIDTAIVGRPNVGKSTLMNLLSGTERSIVTPIAGTTRDVIQETVMIGDIMLKISDTAGIRDTGDEIEKIGVELSIKKLESAQLVLAVFDMSCPLDEQDRDLLRLCHGKNTIVICNKSDLPAKMDMELLKEYALPMVEISAAKGSGLSELCRQIEETTGIAGLSPDTAVLQNERQLAGVKKAAECVAAAGEATLDICGMMLQDAANHLDQVAGAQMSADIADEIFKNFCVGK